MRPWQSLKNSLRRVLSYRRGLRREGSFAAWLWRIKAATNPALRSRLVDEFLFAARRAGVPLLEPLSRRPGFDRMIFLYRGPSERVSLSADFSGLVPDTRFSAVPGTNLQYFAHEFESDARFDYRLVLDSGDYVLDPLNPRAMTAVFGTNSVCWGSEYAPAPEWEARRGVPSGTVEEAEFASEIRGNSRRIGIYLPPGYKHSAWRCASLYVHDGLDYLKVTGITHILDNLIHRKTLAPVMAVFIPPVEREKEYDASPEFARAVARELVPWVDKKYRTAAQPESRAVLGASMGGLISVYLGAHHAEVFGNVASHSGAYLTDAMPRAIRTRPQLASKFHLDVGTYEASYAGKDLVEGNRRLRDALQARKCVLQYREVHEGHSWGSWRARIAEALRFFWGKRN